MGAGPIFIIGMLLIVLPLLILRSVLRGGLRFLGFVIRRRAVPLAQRNQTRAGIGAFLLALSAVVAATGLPFVHPIGVWLVGGVAAFGLLYLCVGIHGSQGARFDFMSAFWWSVFGLGCAAFLVFNKGIPFWPEVTERSDFTHKRHRRNGRGVMSKVNNGLPVFSDL